MGKEGPDAALDVVVGVVTSKFPELENQKEMVDRVYKAADYIAQGGGSRQEALGLSLYFLSSQGLQGNILM